MKNSYGDIALLVLIIVVGAIPVVSAIAQHDPSSRGAVLGLLQIGFAIAQLVRGPGHKGNHHG